MSGANFIKRHLFSAASKNHMQKLANFEWNFLKYKKNAGPLTFPIKLSVQKKFQVSEKFFFFKKMQFL